MPAAKSAWLACTCLVRQDEHNNCCQYSRAQGKPGNEFPAPGEKHQQVEQVCFLRGSISSHVLWGGALIASDFIQASPVSILQVPARCFTASSDLSGLHENGAAPPQGMNPDHAEEGATFGDGKQTSECFCRAFVGVGAVLSPYAICLFTLLLLTNK